MYYIHKPVNHRLGRKDVDLFGLFCISGVYIVAGAMRAGMSFFFSEEKRSRKRYLWTVRSRVVE